MLKINQVSYCYLGRVENTLQDISLVLEHGEMLLLAGKSGCGKSTLLKAISGVLKDGQHGTILINGQDISQMPLEDIGFLVGTVYQSPEDQLFAMTVEDEVGFALENRGVSAQEIREAVADTLHKVGLKGFEKTSIHCLSGGQKQRLAVASVLITKPKILILDEPVSQMNPQGVKDFMEMLCELNKNDKITIIIAEHRVNELAGYFARLAIMSEGRIVYDGPIEGAWQQVSQYQFKGLREPQTIKLGRALRLSVLNYKTEKAVQIIKNECKIFTTPKASKLQSSKGELLLSCSDLAYQYRGAQKATITDISLQLYAGEIVALMGANGAGKSTLLNILAGLTKPTKGSLELKRMANGKQGQFAGYLRQEPDLMLLADTVWEELVWQNKTVDSLYIEDLLEKMNLTKYRNDFPLALSKGQRLRTVLGALLARKPFLLILDEPTAGQDQESLEEIKKLVSFFAQAGGCVLFCTHDIELAAELADRVLLMQAGKLLSDQATSEVLIDKETLSLSGLAEPPMLKVSEQLGLQPCIKVEEVLAYVDASTVGR
ncbi:MAG TPA: ATP-binding cassette domain-containing protein [Candidatus Avacidaminococcus intestinavium]|uniref:ATP-binding cassette domain-containing protein n=1 Tax=Candidatus Avacidaminococcus intestinavium TaxID=2840684 RepID=A0A9D1SM75_9FIRM|nr:ATP-binding cassette domain-containing protein [Candidatus Avacidaminococcus intestinavium]